MESEDRAALTVMVLCPRFSPLAVLALAAFCTCQRPAFVRNPHLQLLKADPDASLEHPIVAPDGATVFYISAGSWLCRLDIAADTAVALREGWLQAFAISPDGTRLALLGRELLLADTAGAVLDTLVPAESIESDPVDVEFGLDGSRIYYSVRSYSHGAFYYRVGLDGTGRELVHESYGSAESPRGVAGFDLTVEDSVVDYYAGQNWPQFSPLNGDIMAYASSGWFGSHGDITLLNLSTGAATALECNPYRQSWTDYPYWFPDGRKLVFAATDSGRSGPYQLWTLDDIEY